ncbi:hypothetical protein [Halobacterium wangiae]|uniref:hypothetical protein n=1 Tax=Halobacterium wangiae TaxID=2902623 RepID=UPI001E444CA1|nr:hypothetical protein [Halobacterium wangiae]
MPAGDDAVDADATSHAADTEAAEAALSGAIDGTDGDPICTLCSKPADYFLYDPGSVEKFVCWEHVSPHSAAVDGEDPRPGRPVALSL